MLSLLSLSLSLVFSPKCIVKDKLLIRSFADVLLQNYDRLFAVSSRRYVSAVLIVSYAISIYAGLDLCISFSETWIYAYKISFYRCTIKNIRPLPTFAKTS